MQYGPGVACRPGAQHATPAAVLPAVRCPAPALPAASQPLLPHGACACTWSGDPLFQNPSSPSLNLECDCLQRYWIKDMDTGQVYVLESGEGGRGGGGGVTELLSGRELRCGVCVCVCCV